MPWMKVTDISAGDTVINTDAVARFHEAPDGTVIWFVNRTMIRVSDPMEEIIQVVLKADEKKK